MNPPLLGRYVGLLHYKKYVAVSFDLATYSRKFMNAPIFNVKGLVIHKQKSLYANLRLIAKRSYCFIGFLLLVYVSVYSFGHVGALYLLTGT